MGGEAYTERGATSLATRIVKDTLHFAPGKIRELSGTLQRSVTIMPSLRVRHARCPLPAVAIRQARDCREVADPEV